MILSPVQNQGPLYWYIIRGPSPVQKQGPIYLYRTKPFHRYRTKGQSTGTEPSPFTGTEPKALHQCRTKNPSPVQNQGPLYWNLIMGPSPVQNQKAAISLQKLKPFTSKEPRVALPVKCCIPNALHQYRTKDRSDGTEPNTQD
jgi:hypothetical protein